jgi:hypothetical protein
VCRILEAIENIPEDEQAALVATRLVAFSGLARGQQTISSPGYQADDWSREDAPRSIGELEHFALDGEEKLGPIQAQTLIWLESNIIGEVE